MFFSWASTDGVEFDMFQSNFLYHFGIATARSEVSLPVPTKEPSCRSAQCGVRCHIGRRALGDATYWISPGRSPRSFAQGLFLEARGSPKLLRDAAPLCVECGVKL
mmetsp:Transcript_4167/g.14965  ORF Transcript_4167/g.14965 Transcript_4167/m.14965 type:complete len:106 (-) Transcript_4167:43-360(-)